MTKWLFAVVLLSSISAGAQQQNVSQIPDCSLGTCAGLGIPAFTCNSGQKYARVDAPGSNYTCTGFPPHWVADTSGGGGLPVAGSSGQAPVSTGAGTTYNAQPVAQLATSNVFTNTQNFVNSEAFTSGQANLHVQTLINGCDPSFEYHAVQFNFETEAITGCITGTAGAATHQITAIAGYATSANTVPAVGGYLQGRCTANGAHCFGFNAVVQDVAGLTTGGLMSHELDIQPFNPPSAYVAGDGLNIILQNNLNQGSYPFTAINIGASNGPSATGPGQWNTIFKVQPGILPVNADVFYVGAAGTAVSGTNWGSPVLFRMFESAFVSGAPVGVDWNLQARVGSGNNPAFDNLYLFQNGSTNIPLHHFTLASYQNMDLAFQESDGNFATIKVPALQIGGSVFNLPTGTGVAPVFSAAASTNFVPVVTNGPNTTLGSSEIIDAGAGVVVGSATGGAQGAGTLNAVNLYVNGVAVGGGGGGGIGYPGGTGIPTVVGGAAWGSTITPASGLTTWFTTPSSANLISLLTDETGTGSAVFAGSPAFAGTPTVPTASAATNTTQIASTAFVNNIFAAPPAIGSTTPAAGNFTTLSATSGISTGSGPTSCGSATGCLALSDGSTAGTPTAGQAYIRSDSTSGQLLFSIDGSPEAPIGSGGTGILYPSATATHIPAAVITGGVTSLTDSSFIDNTTNTFDTEPLFLVGEYQQATGTANSGNNFVSNPTNWLISYWNGTTAVSAAWNVYAWVAQGASPPASVLTYAAPANLTTTAVLYAIDPGLAATSSINFASPKFKTRGAVWNGSASILDDWNWQNVYGTGGNPTATLQFTHSGSSGAATVEMPGLKLDGNPEIASGVSTNSDISGEFALSSATTAGPYAWQNTYASHPECVLENQFSTTTASWVTYSGTTSFTINFASAVTGTVGYVCVGRN